MSYLNRSSEIDRVFDSDISDCESDEAVFNNPEDLDLSNDDLEEGDGFLTVDDLFSDGDEDQEEVSEVLNTDNEVGYTNVNYKVTCGKETRDYLAYPPPHSRRTRSNIIRERQGLKVEGKVNSIVESIDLFFPQEAVDIIVAHTNEEANLVNVSQTDIIEIRAFIGILVLMGANDDTQLSVTDLWSNNLGRPVYIAGMSRNRFVTLLRIVRFDDKQTRAQRRENDKLAPIRELFEAVNSTFVKYFTPSSNVVIDEMLSLFRGRCPFKVFMKEKPGKYGILIRILADCDMRMVIKMEAYCGKRLGVDNGTVAIVERLIEPITNSGRNLTTDRFYTSVVLAEKLYQDHNLTIVGTMQSNRKFIPKELKNIDNRPLHSSMFAFTDTRSGKAPITLQSFVAKEKPKRNLIFLSTQHQDDKVQEDGKHKSDINLFYNQTKGGVDSVDQMARKFTTKRSTQRWPLSLFYTIIDIACINAYSLFILNDPEWNKAKHNRRRLYLQEVGLQLIIPNIQRRAKNTSGLHKHIIFSMESILSTNIQGPIVDRPSASSKGRCHVCSSEALKGMKKKLSKTTIVCFKCNKYVCGKHNKKTNVCLPCETGETESE